MKPSAVLDAIAQGLLVHLSPKQPGPDAPPIRVLVSDRTDEDVTDTETVGGPALVLSCTGFSDQEIVGGAMIVDADFLVRCYARLPQGPSDAKASRGDVAMNLAALVAQVVSSTMWTGPDGDAVVVRAADRVRVANRTARAQLSGDGHAMWTVRWTQRFELTPVDHAEVLQVLRRLFVQWDLGGETDTPQESELIEVTHG